MNSFVLLPLLLTISLNPLLYLPFLYIAPSFSHTSFPSPFRLSYPLLLSPSCIRYDASTKALHYLGPAPNMCLSLNRTKINPYVRPPCVWPSRAPPSSPFPIPASPTLGRIVVLENATVIPGYGADTWYPFEGKDGSMYSGFDDGGVGTIMHETPLLLIDLLIYWVENNRKQGLGKHLFSTDTHTTPCFFLSLRMIFNCVVFPLPGTTSVASDAPTFTTGSAIVEGKSFTMLKGFTIQCTMVAFLHLH